MGKWWISHRSRHKYLMIMMFLPSIKSLFFMLLLLLLVLSQFSIIRTSTTINVDLMATADEAMSASASDSVEVGKGGQTSVVTERYTICTGSKKWNGYFRKLLPVILRLDLFMPYDGFLRNFKLYPNVSKYHFVFLHEYHSDKMAWISFLDMNTTPVRAPKS